VDVREVYYDGSNLRVIFRVVERKWFAAGIVTLNERVALSIDGKIVQTVSVQGFEPRLVLADLKLTRGRHYAIVYGVLEKGGLDDGKLESPNGAICI